MPLLLVLCWLVLAWTTPLLPRAGAAVLPRPAGSVPSSGRWATPLSGPLDIRRPFVPPAARWGAGHRGVDLAAAPGTPVRAAGAGVVSFAGVLAGRGVLVVSHGALRTTYEPVTARAPTGRAVAAGDVVAALAPGHPGPARAGEALLHWGLLRGDTYLDPLLLLRGPSRLVPVAPADPPPRPAGRARGGTGDRAAWLTAGPAATVPGPAPGPAPHAPRAARRAAPAAGYAALGAGSAAVAVAAAGAGRRPRSGRRRRIRPPPGARPRSS